MTESATPFDRSTHGAPSIFDRVSDRVSAAAAALDTGARAPRRPAQTRALWRVFHDFGVGYRRQRRESGVSPVPGVRDAAEAFRRDPTLTTLVAVASVLQENGFSG
jgi:hypothetical protein